GWDVNGNGTVGDPGDVLSYQDFTGGSYVGHTDTPLGWMNSYDQDGTANCYLSDDEKDIDGDGLSNFTEAHGPLSGPEWWTNYVPKAGTYYINYTGTNWLDRDTDGDGIADGSDDQDHDGYSNIEESLPIGGPDATAATSLRRFPVEGDFPNVEAFNPCLPNIKSPACSKYIQGT